MADRCVVRNAQYRRGGLKVRQRHNERQNADYMNDDIVKDRAAYNVHFKQSTDSYESTFDAMVADKTISTRGLGKLLAIYNRLSAHGLRDLNYYLFSGDLLDVQEELRELDVKLRQYGGIPYSLDKIPQTILAVPDDKVYVMSANLKEEIDQLRQIATGELAR